MPRGAGQLGGSQELEDPLSPAWPGEDKTLTRGMGRRGPPAVGGMFPSKCELRHHLAPHPGDLVAGWSAQGEKPRTGPSHTSSGVGMLEGQEHSERHKISRHSRFLRLKSGFFNRHTWESAKPVYKQ